MHRKLIGLAGEDAMSTGTYAPHDITVIYSMGSAACTTDGSNTMTFKFLTDLGDLPLLEGSVASLTLTGSSPTMDFAESVEGTLENIECGGQGKCNTAKGICACFPGYDSSDGSGGAGERGDCGLRLTYPNVYKAFGDEEEG